MGDYGHYGVVSLTGDGRNVRMAGGGEERRSCEEEQRREAAKNSLMQWIESQESRSPPPTSRPPSALARQSTSRDSVEKRGGGGGRSGRTSPRDSRRGSADREHRDREPIDEDEVNRHKLIARMEQVRAERKQREQRASAEKEPGEEKTTATTTTTTTEQHKDSSVEKEQADKPAMPMEQGDQAGGGGEGDVRDALVKRELEDGLEERRSVRSEDSDDKIRRLQAALEYEQRRGREQAIREELLLKRQALEREQEREKEKRRQPIVWEEGDGERRASDSFSASPVEGDAEVDGVLEQQPGWEQPMEEDGEEMEQGEEETRQSDLEMLQDHFKNLTKYIKNKRAEQAFLDKATRITTGSSQLDRQHSGIRQLLLNLYIERDEVEEHIRYLQGSASSGPSPFDSAPSPVSDSSRQLQTPSPAYDEKRDERRPGLSYSLPVPEPPKRFMAQGPSREEPRVERATRSRSDMQRKWKPQHEVHKKTVVGAPHKGSKKGGGGVGKGVGGGGGGKRMIEIVSAPSGSGGKKKRITW